MSLHYVPRLFIVYPPNATQHYCHSTSVKNNRIICGEVCFIESSISSLGTREWEPRACTFSVMPFWCPRKEFDCWEKNDCNYTESPGKVRLKGNSVRQFEELIAVTCNVFTMQKHPYCTVIGDIGVHGDQRWYIPGLHVTALDWLWLSLVGCVHTLRNVCAKHKCAVYRCDYMVYSLLYVWLSLSYFKWFVSNQISSSEHDLTRHSLE